MPPKKPFDLLYVNGTEQGEYKTTKFSTCKIKISEGGSVKVFDSSGSPMSQSQSSEATLCSLSSFSSSVKSQSAMSDLLAINEEGYEQFKNDYKLMDVIGEGAFGKVRKFQHKITNEIVAVKSAQMSRNLKNEEIVKATKREIEVLMKFSQHPNLVKMLFNFSHHEKVYLGLEYCSFGSLRNFLQKTQFRLHETVLRHVFHCALSGLDYLHQNGVLHLDIKPDNLLVDEKGTVKLADFGTSRIRDLAGVGDQTLGLTQVTGTSIYIDPEIWKSQGAKSTSDIWSLGCTMIELATAVSPWVHLLDDRHQNPSMLPFVIVTRNEVPAIPSHLSNDLKRLLSMCLQHQREKRASAASLLSDPYFSSYSTSSISCCPHNDVQSNPGDQDPLEATDDSCSNTAGSRGCWLEHQYQQACTCSNSTIEGAEPLDQYEQCKLEAIEKREAQLRQDEKTAWKAAWESQNTLSSMVTGQFSQELREMMRAKSVESDLTSKDNKSY